MTHTTTTDEIRAQIDQARDELRNTEALVGTAQLEGNPTGPAQKQLAKARDTVNALEAALTVAEHRDQDAAAHATADEWRAKRHGYYARNHAFLSSLDHRNSPPR